MPFFEITLLLATFLCTLVAGFLFAFAVVAMPGLGTLDDRAFLRAFQVMDRIIQDNQPLFMLVWVGSVIALLASAVSWGQLDPAGRWLLGTALVVYVLGVQAPTVAINVPLNNTLQAFDVEDADDATCRATRQAFEARWNRSNVARTVLACVTSLLLLLLLLR